MLLMPIDLLWVSHLGIILSDVHLGPCVNCIWVYSLYISAPGMLFQAVLTGKLDVYFDLQIDYSLGLGMAMSKVGSALMWLMWAMVQASSGELFIGLLWRECVERDDQYGSGEAN